MSTITNASIQVLVNELISRLNAINNLTPYQEILYLTKSLQQINGHPEITEIALLGEQKIQEIIDAAAQASSDGVLQIQTSADAAEADALAAIDSLKLMILSQLNSYQLGVAKRFYYATI